MTIATPLRSVKSYWMRWKGNISLSFRPSTAGGNMSILGNSHWRKGEEGGGGGGRRGSRLPTTTTTTTTTTIITTTMVMKWWWVRW